MAIKDIVLAGNPMLHSKALPITDFKSPQLTEVINNMFDTMKSYNGAGISAPQIGAPFRIMVYGFTHNPRYPNQKPVPETVLINPEILEFSEDEEELYEGCLSLTGLRGIVPRSLSITYKAFLPSGQEILNKISGFEARIIQHELDHLDGILFPSRVKDARTFAMFDELKRQQRL